MLVNFKELLCAFSDALDFVESDLFGLKKDHGKHVAYMAAKMGLHAGLSSDEISDLMACALLHDNALCDLSQGNKQEDVNTVLNSPGLAAHCIQGESNISKMVFYENVKDVVLYHHEWGNGGGPFHKTYQEVPFFSRLIHLADVIDITFYTQDLLEQGQREEAVLDFLQETRNSVFDEETVSLFEKCIEEGIIGELDSVNANYLINEVFPNSMRDFDFDDIINIGLMFSTIIDYKSSFTKMHSSGIAQKALDMARYYKWDKETQAKYFLAGSLHDIGKLAINTAVLEKPGKLTDEEFEHIKNHAQITWHVLHRIHGFEDITEWAGNHHERLNGTGYPNGKSGLDLDYESRLLACIDVYQALREDRPYRAGMTHEKAMRILYEEAAANKLDGQCVGDIDIVMKET